MPAEAPPWFQEIDHTGDVGIAVTASDLETLFARAAWGLFRVLADVNAVAPHETREVVVEANDREALLVEWLSELNFRHVTKGWLFCDFDVQALSETHLTAQVRGEPYDADRHAVYTEVKAVTFHGLRIEQQNGVWRVQVVFDM